MSYFVTKYPAGTFCLADIYSKDMDKATEFLTKLFGWTREVSKTEGKPDYTVYLLEGKTVAGGAPSFNPEIPSVWNNYVSVDDAQAIMRKAEELGGRRLADPIDIEDKGILGMLQDPQGAMFSVWQPKNIIGAQVVNKAGAMSWNELYTPDLESSKKFYGDLFGWTFETEEGYTTIKNNGRMNGGIMELTPEMGNMPPNWTVYFTVEDLNGTLERVKELGGSVYMEPKEIGPGKIAMIAEPTGAAFMIIEMSVPPEEWPE